MGTSTWGHSPRLRDQQSRREFEQKAPETQADRDAAFWAQAHERDKARQRRVEQEEQERYREAEEYVRQKKAEEKRRMLERLLAATYGATPEEITRVDNLVRAYTPGDYGKFDVHAAKLLELRAVLN